MKQYRYIFTIVILFVIGVFLTISLLRERAEKTHEISESKEKTYLIQTDTYSGAVITIDGEKNWCPDKRMIDEFETNLISYLKSDKAASHISGGKTSIAYIKEHLPDYKRQYVGKSLDGDLILHCNFLLFDQSRDMDWTKRYIQVKDGGANFFNIDYDLKKKKFLRFCVNGLA